MSRLGQAAAWVLFDSIAITFMRRHFIIVMKNASTITVYGNAHVEAAVQQEQNEEQKQSAASDRPRHQWQQQRRRHNTNENLWAGGAGCAGDEGWGSGQHWRCILSSAKTRPQQQAQTRAGWICSSDECSHRQALWWRIRHNVPQGLARVNRANTSIIIS